MSVITMSHPEAYMSQPSLLCYWLARGTSFQITDFHCCCCLNLHTVTCPHYFNSCCSDGEWYWMSFQIFPIQPHDLLCKLCVHVLSAWIVFFLPVEDWESWHFLNRKSLPKFVICKYFLPVYSIPSYSLQIFSHRKTFYNYPKIQAFFTVSLVGLLLL